MNKFDIDYANTITNADRLNHHLSQCSKETLLAIKENFSKCPKKIKLFSRATKGMAAI